MRRTRTSPRTGALVLAALAAGILFAAPAGQAASPAASTSALTAGGLRGGDQIPGSSYRCAIGFNLRDSSGGYYFVTAARCAGISPTWYFDSTHTRVLGTTVYSRSDYVVVKYAAGIVPPGTVDLYNGASQDITSAANAFVGEAVKRSGPVTGVRSGTVTALNVTVNYAEGSVSGLIRTNVCAEGGDLGGPLFDATKALGVMTQSGSGNCSFGGVTYYRPVTEILAATGLAVY